MPLQFPGRLIGAATLAAFLTAPLTEPAQAISLNGWDYAIAPFNNGVTFDQIGGGTFEFYSLAIQSTDSTISVALNANLPLNGSNGITWGDLFFNFSGRSFKSASNAGQLVGVRFAAENSDSGASELGIYQNVSAKSVTSVNSGFTNLTEYSATVAGNDSFGDLNALDPYFEGQQSGTATILNAIDAGTKVGDITFLTTDRLATAGLSFSSFGATGSQTIGFSLEKPDTFKGSFIVSVFAECANDGLVLQSQGVPEPTAIAGLAIAGLGLALRHRKRID